jgi:hypothetical protein
VAEGNRRQEHGEVLEGADGEVNEHRSMKAELGDAASGPGSGRRRLVPMGSRWQRAIEQSGGGACSWMKVKWGEPSSARCCAEIKPRPCGAMATDGVRSPPRHRVQCCARVHG